MAKLIIGTYFRRPNAPIELANPDGTVAKYFFRPVDPKNPDSEHVACVESPAHQQRLLAIAEGYYISETQNIVENAAAIAASTIGKPNGQAAPTPPTQPEPASIDTNPVAPPAPPAGPASNPLPTTVPETAEQIATAAAALLALKLSSFKEQAKKADQHVLREALRLESAKTDDEQRATVIKELSNLLKG